MKEYTHMTCTNLVTVRVRKNKVVLTSKTPKLKISLDACYIFDILAGGLNVNSTSFAISRRARQLNGMSLADCIAKQGKRV